MAAPITVSSLGMWDDNADGLGASYNVAIWNKDTLAQLVAAIVPSGLTGTLANNFRYASLPSSTTLPTGTYRIGAYFSSNTDLIVDRLLGSGTATANSGITLGSSYTTAGGSLAYPSTDTTRGPGYIGPNFQFTAASGGAASAPAPLPILGAAATWGFSRRLRQRIRSHRRHT